MCFTAEMGAWIEYKEKRGSGEQKRIDAMNGRAVWRMLCLAQVRTAERCLPRDGGGKRLSIPQKKHVDMGERAS